jgi:hypothetical protein
VRALQCLVDVGDRLFRRGLADFRTRARAETLRDLEAELDATVASDALSACASVLATMKSTP